MAVKMLPQETANAFVEQYYVILNKCPEHVHKFYQESSFIGWPEPNGDMTPVTTLNGISEKVMSSDYKYCSVDLSTVDAQDSFGGGVLVNVTGSLTTQGGEKKRFNQIFFLAEQQNGYYVLNDILRFFDLGIITSDVVSNDGNKDEDGAPSSEALQKTDEHVGSEAPESPGSAFPPIKVAVAKNASSVSIENTKPVTPASPTKVKAPKISYASMVAKVTPVTSPKASLAATSDARNQTGASKAPKPATKEAAATSQVAKNVSSTNPSANAEVKGLIYVGGLPYDITKQGIVAVLQKFGPVKKHAEAIHIKRHEDGFCCGFVEFESADAAQRAADVRNVKFGEKEAYITLKKPPNNRNSNDSRGRSSQRGGPGTRNLKARDDAETTKNQRWQ